MILILIFISFVFVVSVNFGWLPVALKFISIFDVFPSPGVGGLRDVETLIPTKALLEKLAAKSTLTPPHTRTRTLTHSYTVTCIHTHSLTQLLPRYPMAVVTGRPKEDCDYFLQLHGLDHLFKVTRSVVSAVDDELCCGCGCGCGCG